MVSCVSQTCFGTVWDSGTVNKGLFALNKLIFLVPGDAVFLRGGFFGAAIFAAFGDPAFDVTGHLAQIVSIFFFLLDADLFGGRSRRRSGFRPGLDDLNYALFH